MRRFLLCLTVSLLAVGCATPLTTREKGAMIGAATGSAAGAAVGNVFGRPALGAAAGAAIGTLGGWVIGDQVQARQTPPPAPVSAPAPPPLPPVSATTVTGDPTRGAFVNGTDWTLSLSIAPAGEPAKASPLSIAPGSTALHALDIGQYRVQGTASVATQFGPRTIGSVDRLFSVDPRSTGWRVTFNPYDFK